MKEISGDRTVNKSLGKNAVLNIIKSAMAVIFPLLTFPYVSNVLGVDSLGRYNFSYSVNSYFLMLAALGILSYAIREGAALRDDRQKLSQFSSEIYTINLLSSLVAYLLLFICVATIPKINGYYDCILVFSLEIIFTSMGAEWLYIIYEEYTYITIRRVSFQLLSMILLFLFIKDSEDVLLYTGITVFANAGANILNVINFKKYCNIRFIFNKNLKRHLKPILIIFASTLAIKIYTSSDMIMLGFFSGDEAVGLYSVAVKVYNVLKPLLSAILVVAVPRLAAYVGSGKHKEYVQLLQKLFHIMIVLVLPAIVGLFMISKHVILLLSNESFLQANASLKMLSIGIIFSIFSSFYNQCVLIPLKLEKCFLKATIISAIANVLLNFILVPLFTQGGAAISTVIAEAVSMLMCYKSAKTHVKIKNVRHIVLTSGCGCVGIICTCYTISIYISNNIASIIMSIVASLIVYSVLLIMMKNEVYVVGIKRIHDKIKKLQKNI